MAKENEYDAFLSYNSNDREQVEKIAKWLSNDGLTVWFDHIEIKPRENFLKKIIDGLSRSKGCVIFIGKDGFTGFHEKEVEAVINYSIINQKFWTIPVLLAGVIQPEKFSLFHFLTPISWVEFTNTPIDSNDIEALTLLASGIRNTQPEIGDEKRPPSENKDHNGQGAVLLGNIMQFSSFKPYVQKEINDFLRKRLEEFAKLFPECNIDYRKGEFIVFLEQSKNINSFVLLTVLLYGIKLQIESKKIKYKLGITIHWEYEASWTQIVKKYFLVGSALNEAKRFMSFSGKDHFIISDRVNEILDLEDISSIKLLIKEYKNGIDGLSNRGKSLANEFGKYFSKPGMIFTCDKFEFHDRHKRIYTLHNIFIKRLGKTVGNQIIPNPMVEIEYRDKRHNDPHQNFIKRLIDADDVTLLGLTHEGTPGFLETALKERLKKRQGFWNNIQIIFPSKSSLDNIIEINRSIEEREARWLGGRKGVYNYLIGLGPEYLTKWECLEYNGYLPFGGDKCIINDKESMRVAFVLPGTDMKEVYTTEIFQGTIPFKQLSEALSLIINNCVRFIEWTIYGVYDEDKKHFKYRGLVNRKNMDKLIEECDDELCFPTVLIMLHAECSGKPTSILQYRTMYNASSDMDKYSNLSGRIIDRDVFMAMGGSPPNDYIEKYNSIEFEGTLNARDRITTAFKKAININPNMPLPERSWKEAAIREINEELGINITQDRLIPHNEQLLHRKNHSLYFKIYSLFLDERDNRLELDIIEEIRPKSKLEQFDHPKLERYYEDTDKFNKLLQTKFESIFIPIYKELGIAE